MVKMQARSAKCSTRCFIFKLGYFDCALYRHLYLLSLHCICQTYHIALTFNSMPHRAAGSNANTEQNGSRLARSCNSTCSCILVKIGMKDRVRGSDIQWSCPSSTMKAGSKFLIFYSIFQQTDRGC